jgi:hypothetical protein
VNLKSGIEVDCRRRGAAIIRWGGAIFQPDEGILERERTLTTECMKSFRRLLIFPMVLPSYVRTS